jgi:hypothetical protein
LFIAYGYGPGFHSDRIVISDETGSDTLIFEGADTSASSLRLPFNLVNEYALTFHHERTETVGYIGFESYADSAQHATLYLQQSGNAFWLDSNYFTVPGKTGPNQPGWVGTPVHYRRTGNAYDTAYLTIGNWTNGAQRTLVVSAIADPQISDIDLKVQGVQFGLVKPRDSICKDFVITNPSDQTVTIDSLVSMSTSLDDYTLTATLPVTVQGHSSVSFPVCIVPGTTWDTTEIRRVIVYYTDSLGLSTSVYTDFYARIVKCVGLTPDSLQFGATIAGGASTKTITITNNTHDSATVSDSVVLYGSIHFSFPNGDPFPMKLGGGESRTFDVTLSDTTAGWQNAQLLLYPRDGAGNLLCSSKNELIVHIVDANDTSALSLFGQQESFLPIVSDLAKITKVFTFVNDAADSIKVLSATLAGSSGHFSIMNIAPSLAAILPHFGRLQVTVEFDADTNGIYRDTLIVVTDNPVAQNYRIPILGSRMNGVMADVSSLVGGTPSLSIYPNPAVNEVRVEASGAEVTEITLLDILGHTVRTATHEPLTVKGLSPGDYIVRVTGRTGNGDPITISRILEVK